MDIKHILMESSMLSGGVMIGPVHYAQVRGCSWEDAKIDLIEMAEKGEIKQLGNGQFRITYP